MSSHIVDIVICYVYGVITTVHEVLVSTKRIQFAYAGTIKRKGVLLKI